MLSRAIIREASARPDNPHLGTTAVQLNVVIGVIAAAVLWAAAPLLSSLTGEPALTRPLRLLCWDIPLFTTAMAHRSLLVGSGAYHARAVLPAVRWIGRLVVVVTLVSLGWSVEGVVIGTPGGVGSRSGRRPDLDAPADPRRVGRDLARRSSPMRSRSSR